MCLAEPTFPCNCADLDARMDGTLPLWDGMIGAQVKTAPGTRSVNCESDSQGLADSTLRSVD